MYVNSDFEIIPKILMYYALPLLQKPRTVCNTNIAKQRTNEIQFFTEESYNLPIQTKQLFVLKDKTFFEFLLQV